MAISTIDFLTPFDPTTYIDISGAMLEQLAGGISPNLGVGLFLATVDIAGVPQVPNPALTPKWASYGWLRLSPGTAGATLYVWNPFAAASPTLLNWQVANLSSFAVGQITGSMIAANTITYQNIQSILWSQLPNGGVVGGCLVGSMPNPALAANVVGNSNISQFAVTGGLVGSIALTTIIAANMVPGTLTNVQFTTIDASGILDANVSSIASGNGLNPIGATGKLSTVNAGGGKTLKTTVLGTQFELFSDAFSNLWEANTQTKYQVPQVNAAGTGLQWKTGSQHTILQIYTEQNNAQFSTATTLAGGTTPTQGNTVLNTNFGSAGTITFTPQSAASTILIELDCILENSVAADGATLALLEGATLLNAATIIGCVYGQSVRLTYWLASTGITPLNFTVQMAALTGGTAYTNRYAYQYSSVKITEYL